MARADLADSEDQLVSRYIGGLTVNFQDSLNMFDPMTVSEAHQRALHVEKQFGRRGGLSSGVRSTGSYSAPFRGGVPPPTPPKQVTDPNTRTQATGSGPVTRSQNGVVRPRCFSCGEPGHRMADCHKRGNHGKGLYIDSEEAGDTGCADGEPLYDGDESLQEEFVEGDTGPLLVVRRACFSPRDMAGDNWLRNHIFQSTCTIGGKVCSLVIDPGSCENVVSQETVGKLNLSTEQHPKPYRLSWLKKGTLVTVSKRCLVSFSIGLY